MVMSNENSLCGYLKQTKMSFYLVLQNWKTARLNKGAGGEWVCEGENGANNVYTCL
jgi:hypothetical protein